MSLRPLDLRREDFPDLQGDRLDRLLRALNTFATDVARQFGGGIDTKDGTQNVIKTSTLNAGSSTPARLWDIQRQFGAGGRSVQHLDGNGHWVDDGKVWNDLQGDVRSATGGGAVVFKLYRDTLLKLFFWSHNQDDELYFTWQMPHTWARTSVRPHMHLIPTGTGSGVARFNIQYAWASFGAEVPAVSGWTSATIDFTIAAADQYIERVLSLAEIEPRKNAQESDVLLLWMRREASNIADTYTASDPSGTAAANIAILAVDTHLQVEKLGTHIEFPGA